MRRDLKYQKGQSKGKVRDAAQKAAGARHGIHEQYKEGPVGLSVLRRTVVNEVEAREQARIKSSGTSSSVHPKSHKKS